MAVIWIVILLLTSVCSALGQSPLAKRSFDDATRAAVEGNFEKALKGYQAAAMSSPDEGEFAAKLRYNLGVCYYRTGQLRPAVKEFNAAIRVSGGQHQRAYYARGMAESALEAYPDARTSFLRAIELNPKDGEAWFDLAFVYLAEHDYESASAAFRKAIDNKSVDSALGHNNLGVISAMRHEFAEAERAFQTAVDLSGGNLVMATSNLEFCRSLKRGNRELAAGNELKFIGRELGHKDVATRPAKGI